jgi:lysophospholipase L1-like esterase
MSNKTKPRIRLLILLAIGAVLISLGAAYYEFFWARPMGEGPAGPPVDPAPFAEVWTERPVEFVGIGDSITAGLGASTPALRAFSRILQNPEDDFPEMQGISLSAVLPNLSFENIAVSGSTSLQHVAMIDNRLHTRDADTFGLIMLTTGGNDIIHTYGRQPPQEGGMYGATLEEARPWIANFEPRLTGILESITARFPGGCEIYLADIYDPTDGVGDAPSVYLPHWPDGLAIHAEYNRIIREVANRFDHVFVVPLYDTFLGHGSHCRQFWRETYVADDPHYWFYDNVEDPNDRGYDAIRRLYLNAIAAHSRLVPR